MQSLQFSCQDFFFYLRRLCIGIELLGPDGEIIHSPQMTTSLPINLIRVLMERHQKNVKFWCQADYSFARILSLYYYLSFYIITNRYIIIIIIKYSLLIINLLLYLLPH